MSQFGNGFRSLLPILAGVIPFGAVMGSAFAEAKLHFWQAILMNTTVYAGASQLATTDLMKLNAAVLVVLATGLIINLRFLLYSAALAPYLEGTGPLTKFFTAFTLTDQGYAVLMANQDKFKTNQEAVTFYLGGAACMFLVWHGSVILGFIFGSFAPESLSLDFAVPLSFLALLVPTLRTRAHKAVAILSGTASLLFHGLPLKTGLLATALISLGFAWSIIRSRSRP